MPDKNEILDVLLATVDEANKELPPEQRLTKSKDTILFGHSGKLDSLGLVNFIVCAEQKLQDRFGVPISLADERAMSQERSPFRTIATMADYVQTLLDEKGEVQSPTAGESSSQAHARESAGI
ncbi:MAG: acyl carrier protein [Candidatus Acidiferrales bacterium]